MDSRRPRLLAPSAVSLQVLLEKTFTCCRLLASDRQSIFLRLPLWQPSQGHVRARGGHRRSSNLGAKAPEKPEATKAPSEPVPSPWGGGSFKQTWYGLHYVATPLTGHTRRPRPLRVRPDALQRDGRRRPSGEICGRAVDHICLSDTTLTRKRPPGGFGGCRCAAQLRRLDQSDILLRRNLNKHSQH